MKITKEIKEELTGLYVTILVKNKYNEKEGVNERFKMHAKRLDDLKVPFILQNMTALAGDTPKNWSRYNSEVINEVIEKYNKILERRKARKAS